MSTALVDFTEKLVSVSDFSQGKAGKIFNDVTQNKTEYIVLKNNQPMAVVMPIEVYKMTQHKLMQFERLMNMVENIQLLNLAKNRDFKNSTSLEDLIEEEGFSLEELELLAESVDIE